MIKLYTKQINSFVAFLFLTFQINAQNATFTDLYDIMQNKCASCHGGANPAANLNLSGSKDDVYNALVDVNPTNTSALNMGNKLAMPGYPERSFLLRKISNANWDETFGLYSGQGTSMPQAPNDPLSHKEIELFRQWILWGAPKNETVVDPQVLEDYYENGMALPTTEPFDAPNPSEGFQVRIGPIFLKPLQEIEFFKKHDLQLEENIEVNKLAVTFNSESHHFIAYKLSQGVANNVAEGIREINFEMGQGSVLATWQSDAEYQLPDGTAYKLKKTDVADMNYHLKNYLTSGILAANVYVNFYTQPDGTAQQEMRSELLPINLNETFFGAAIGNGLVIPADGDEHVFTDRIVIPDFPGIPYPSGTWHVWQISSHTHSRGTDYDIYVSDNSGQKGEQIYEGFYNNNYTFNQGFYDTDHPPVRTFEELYPIDMSLSGGLIHETKYVNTTNDVIQWGYTTDDEMMLIVIQYTTAPLTDIEDISKEESNFQIFPNPFQGETNIKYTLNNKATVQLEVFNLLGERIDMILNEEQSSGTHQVSFSSKNKNLTDGMYIVRLTIDGRSFSQKIVELK